MGFSKILKVKKVGLKKQGSQTVTLKGNLAVQRCWTIGESLSAYLQAVYNIADTHLNVKFFLNFFAQICAD